MSPIGDQRHAHEEICRPLILAGWSVCNDKSYGDYADELFDHYGHILTA